MRNTDAHVLEGEPALSVNATMDGIATLRFEDTDITIINDMPGKGPLFVAAPIAKKLGHRDASDMLRGLDDGEKDTHIVPTLGGPQEMSVITLPGLSHALGNRRFGSIKNPETRAMALRFQQWARNVLLPAFRNPSATIPEYTGQTIEGPQPMSHGGNATAHTIMRFDFHGQPLRGLTMDDMAWFIGKDACDIFGTQTKDLRAILDADEIQELPTNVDTIDIALTGGRRPLVISEAGLYRLVLTSRKLVAKEFQRWVVHEVLPSIRRHGAYMTGDTLERVLTDPDLLIRLATTLKEERAARAKAESAAKERAAQLEAQKPKVLFAESVETSDTSILVGQLAHDLRQNGVNIGQNQLFAYLRDKHYLCSRKGQSWNEPTQASMDAGLFQVKTRVINKPDGTTTTVRTTKVTGKGRIHLTQELLGEGAYTKPDKTKRNRKHH